MLSHSSHGGAALRALAASAQVSSLVGGWGGEDALAARARAGHQRLLGGQGSAVQTPAPHAQALR